MLVTLNGGQELVTESIGLMEFLLTKGLDLNKVVVEYNHNIVKKNDWGKVVLKDNDILEVLSFVGGGLNNE